MTSDEVWGEDLLNVRARGETFTNLIKSIDDSKVVSIEAGFGRGKTFFRQAWVKHLRNEGEVVIEIDAQKSDHAGDPVVTFIAALVEALGPEAESTASKLKKSGLKWAAVGGRAVAGAVIGRAVDGVIDAASVAAAGEEDTSATLETLVDGVGDGLSKVAKQLIATQMKAEKARTEELPKQLDKLRFALTMKEGEDADAKATREKKKGPDRVVILIDELDRCHPDYVIALLEAMKLVFDRKGYVFVLMVNPHSLKRIADHRFGKPDPSDNDEEYLDKFVDIRLSLGATDEVIGEAARALVMDKLDIVGVPFGEGPEFTVERAGEVAAQMAPLSRLSMRQIKRVLLKVEVALRCYQDEPLDLPLLVYLAFRDARIWKGKSSTHVLPRSNLESETAKSILEKEGSSMRSERAVDAEKTNFVKEYHGALIGLDEERYRLEQPQNGEAYYDWFKVLGGLGPYYISEHHAVLDAAHFIRPDGT